MLVEKYEQAAVQTVVLVFTVKPLNNIYVQIL